MPGGASHDARQLVPHGLFVREAAGAFKTGADGRSLIDLQCGNGSLMLGHAYPSVLDAARHAIEAGFNFSAGSEAETRWAEAVQRLMPAAEQVRFTASGNEACALAIAVASAFTGRKVVLVMRDHYYGWIPQALLPKFGAGSISRTPHDRASSIVLVEAENVQEALEVLQSRAVCGVILEPTGGSFGKIPVSADDARSLYTEARKNGSLCIFDETITGFRVAPGGVQQLLGVQPDLTILGKVLAGGLPGGALAGRREVMSALDNRPGGTADAEKISHMGTGNGNPIVAAVGAATLAAIEDGEAIARANRAASRLRAGLNAVFADGDFGWAAYGDHSCLHLFLNPLGRSLDPNAFDPCAVTSAELRMRAPQLVNDLRVQLLENGLDINAWPGGLTSAVHDDAVIDSAVSRFAAGLIALRKSGRILSGWGSE